MQNDPSAPDAANAPDKALASSLRRALVPGLAERDVTAQALAELVLDAAESAVALERGAAAGPSLAALELLATGLDVYSWDGPPGWDEILARGLGPRAGLLPSPPPLSGLGGAADRAAQLRLIEARARGEAGRFLAHGRLLSQKRDPAERPTPAAVLVALHASLLRLVALAAVAAPLELAEETTPSDLPPPAEDALVAEIDARAAVGSDFAAAQDEWLARLLHDNPAAAAAPAFRTFFAGLSQSLRVAVSLRDFRDAAREGRLAADPEALLGAAAGWQPVRWRAIRAGARASWWAELFPAVPPGEPPHAELARECSAALDAIGRLWHARDLSLGGFTSLAAAATARSACALALWEELSSA